MVISLKFILMTWKVLGSAAHCKCLEQDKTNALKISKGFFDVMMILSLQSIIDIQWCYNKIGCSKNNITKGTTGI